MSKNYLQVAKDAHDISALAKESSARHLRKAEGSKSVAEDAAARLQHAHKRQRQRGAKWL
jgi:hypothetical protein